jgi:hypothetical protein
VRIAGSAPIYTTTDCIMVAALSSSITRLLFGTVEVPAAEGAGLLRKLVPASMSLKSLTRDPPLCARTRRCSQASFVVGRGWPKWANRQLHRRLAVVSAWGVVWSRSDRERVRVRDNFVGAMDDGRPFRIVR